ncbi:hypothetical protein TNCV_1491581 [Trichonephila clavipes]|nr:hypothetical protein TNCV_1491581 [Trichonephila clavipes]
MPESRSPVNEQMCSIGDGSYRRRCLEHCVPRGLLQLEESTPSTTPYRDHHRRGPLRLPGGRKDALRESQKRNNEHLNGKRMLYVIKEKPFSLRFPLRS